MLALYCLLSAHRHEIEDRIYNQKDYDRNLVIDERTKREARKVSEVLKESGRRFQKTIVFCAGLCNSQARSVRHRHLTVASLG